ncbi:MAG: cation:proton antiporter [Alicyclobacillaceae bacterium]|jgi:Kef-type K+ transport system membrane component KefB/nucleotide-binding universal stress UspA family protein|uniref:cation:proton antiporter domain-containing protein n=1 Tax=Alicyclobacillus sp. SP_1 TaxID=2942475 RepID=UPI002157A0DF|nr:cation:proton antiporter [Alicyclobacillus sp. SP_1]MCY0888399.1 cation:proton antiporter [Alicyclobacillaceae bacterium]
MTSIEILRFLLEFALLLIAARGLGELARRLGQPQVIGELFAGILLGPSLFGWIFPSAYQSVFPNSSTQSLLLQLVSDLGVIFLLLLSGIEVDIPIVRSKAKSAPVIALASVFVPFIGGYGLAQVLSPTLMGGVGNRPVFALFLATAMSISAIPVIVKILLDMDLMRRDIGQLTVAAGVINDTSGWFLLSIVAGLATARSLPLTSIAISIFGTLAFAVFAFTVGYWLIRALIRYVDDHFGDGTATIAAVIVVGLIGAAITEALHVEAYLGAFIVGVQLSRIPRVKRAAREQLKTMTLGIFAPVFFAVAGLKVNILPLLSPIYLATLVLVIVVACAGKFVGTYIGARMVKIPKWTAVALGSGMNARGAVEIIVATVGLQIGVLTPGMYSIIVLMAVATSMMAPPLLRWSLKRAPVNPQEEARLKQEVRRERSFLHGIEKMLVPIRDGRNAMIAARVASHLAGERGIDATALHVGPSRGRKARDKFDIAPLITPTSAQVSWQVREAADTESVASTIIAESKKDYDLLILGSAARPAHAGLFGQVVDSIVRHAACPTWVWSMPPETAFTGNPERILLLTTGIPRDQRVAELAFALARNCDASVTVLHVIESNPLSDPFGVDLREQLDRKTSQAEAATQYVCALADGLGMAVQGKVLYSRGQVGTTICDFARDEHFDLIMMHADWRFSEGELYCGNTVEQVLNTSEGPVAVLFDAF